MNYRQQFATLETPQSEQAHPDQVEISAGGFSFALDDWKRLERFLILGVEGPTYYADTRALVRENAECVLRCLKADPERTVAMITAISESGRAPKNDPAIFALAACSTHPAALEDMPRVCRIGTHLFQYLEFVEGFRGWGRGLRRAVARWYEEMDAGKLAYQVAKYQQRNGWSHWDALRLSHPTATTPEHSAIYDWICAQRSDKHEINPQTRNDLPPFFAGWEGPGRSPEGPGRSWWPPSFCPSAGREAESRSPAIS